MNTTTPNLLAALLLAGAHASPARAQGRFEIQDTLYLLPSDIGPYQEFGTSVDVDGDTLVVGSEYDDDLGLNSGSAYVFVRNGSSWSFQAKLHDPTPHAYDRFGRAVAVSGDILVVGARESFDSSVGSVTVFRRTGTAWAFEAQMQASDAAAFWEIGTAVDVEGERIVAGAPQPGHSCCQFTQDQGAAYVFERVNGIWTQVALLHAADGQDYSGVGQSVALSGDSLLVGAPGKRAAYAFTRGPGGVWSQQAKLEPAGAFGWGSGVQLEGDRAVIASWSANTYAGSVEVWQRTGSAWSSEAGLAPGAEPTPSYTGFGMSIALHGDRLAVGAPRRMYSGFTGQPGSTFVFVRRAGAWGLESVVEAAGGTSEDEFGFATAWHGDELIVGARARWEFGIRSGAVYACDLDLRAKTYCAVSPNSAGPGAVIGALGTLSIAGNDFTLACSGLPPGSVGKFYYGPAQVQVPFGNGLRCVGGGAHRLYPTLVANPAGAVTRLLDFTQAPAGAGPGQVVPGSTWYFQYWFRNAAAGGAGFNLSDGIGATFVP